MLRLTPFHELRSESLTGFWAAADVRGERDYGERQENLLHRHESFVNSA